VSQIAHRLAGWYLRPALQSDELLRFALAELTPREQQVLLLLARGMTTDEVADELAIGVTTVRTHLHRLRTKLKSRTGLSLCSSPIGPA